MYNSLTLLALVPLMGPEIIDAADLTPPQSNIVTKIQYAQPDNKTFTLPPHSPTTHTQNLTQITAANKTEQITPTQNHDDNQLRKITNNQNTTNTTKTNTNNTANNTANNTTANPPKAVNELTTSGYLEVPKHNQVILAAPCSAILINLKTTQDDGAKINITEGINIKKGQLLGNFDDRILQNQLRIDEAQLNVAIAAEKKITEIEFAARSVQIAITKLNILKEANSRHAGTIPAVEILLAQHEVLQAEANLELSKYTIEHERKEETNVKRQTIEATKTNIKIRQLTAPIDGIITKIERSEGEYVKEGEPILEITQLDTLRAVCKVEATYCSPNQLKNNNVTINVKKINGNAETFNGKIVFVNPKIISMSNQYDIFIEIKNQKEGDNWKLIPGSTIEAKIKLQ
ncbi:MAG: HlyD family efflux transporter periplasmic adaptor subunit [Planctomycetaceae bacterium]|jgi:Cu(I)/Ag(I) efflux system membrane fusion protein|nr:HlyD family efflux transporter periplasmic adaptor subunit [Planctomycetaceae bacterium]